MGNHFRGRDGAHAQALLERAALRLAGEGAGGELLTRPGCVDHLGDRLGRHRDPLSSTKGHRAFFAAGDDQGLDPAARRRYGGAEIRLARQRLYLLLIGDADVDLAAIDELVETVPVAGDAEAVGEAEDTFQIGRAPGREK